MPQVPQHYGIAISKFNLTRAQVHQWLQAARKVNFRTSAHQRGVLMLEQLLAALTPKETGLLPNYPNPFNPETWIPYQLSEPEDVTVSIYSADGKLIRTLALGDQPVGIYESRNRAAYWNGKNELGESVASGVYFIHVICRRVRSNTEDAYPQIVSNDHRITGSLMFIGFPTRKTGMYAIGHVLVLCVAKGAVRIFFLDKGS